MWVQGALPLNSTERHGFCVRSTVHLSKAVSPAFHLQEYNSKDYSTWTESRWKSIKGRIFLVASHDLEVNWLLFKFKIRNLHVLLLQNQMMHPWWICFCNLILYEKMFIPNLHTDRLYFIFSLDFDFSLFKENVKISILKPHSCHDS